MKRYRITFTNGFTEVEGKDILYAIRYLSDEDILNIIKVELIS